MKKTLKKGLAYLLAVSMIITFIPMAAFGAETPANAGSANDTVSLSATAEDGMTAYITAAAGVLPADASVTVSKVENVQPVKELIKEQTTVGDMAAYDVTIFDGEGNEIQPNGEVNVMFRNADINGSDVKVFHMKGEADAPEAAEEVDTSLATGSMQVFSTDGFSVYVVVADDSTGDLARLAVNFVGADGTITTIYVKKKDITDGEFDKVLYDPGAGQLGTDEMFRGWSTTQDYIATTEAKNIKKVREEVKNKLEATGADAVGEGDSVTYYAMIFNAYHITYFDENDTVLGTQEILIPKYETNKVADYKVNMSYTAGASSNFEGWFVKEGGNKIQGYDSTANEGKGTLYKNTDEIKITGSVQFSVNAPEGHWLVFNENGKGATYNAAQFLKKNETTPKTPLKEMKRLGYTFEGDLEGHEGSGWYTGAPAEVGGDPTGSEFVFGGKLEDNTTIYAKWIPNEKADYTVIIWKQSADGKDSSGKKLYDFVESVTVEDAIVGSTPNAVNTTTGVVTGAKYKGETGFTYASTDQASKTVATEGNTIVNVYYDRNEITFNFYTYQYTYTATTGNGGTQYGIVNNEYVELTRYNGQWYYYSNYNWHTYSDTRYTRDGEWTKYKTMTGLYGTTLAANNYSWPTEYDWYDNYQGNEATGTRTTFLHAFMPTSNNTTINFYGNSPEGSRHIYFYQQNADKTGYELKNTINTDATGFHLSDKYDGFKCVAWNTSNNTTNWNKVGELMKPENTDNYYYDANPNQNGYQSASFSNNLYVYFNRLEYPLTFMNGAYYNGENVLLSEITEGKTFKTVSGISYGADISSYNKDGDNYYIPAKLDNYPDFTFAGWYVDDQCTTPATFNKMTEGGVTVYAKWIKTQYRVFLHPNVPTDDNTLKWTATEDGAKTQAMNFRVSYGDTVSVPTGLRTGYELIGWFLDEDCTEVFNAEAVRLNDDTVTADYNKDRDMTDNMNKWGIIESGSPKPDGTQGPGYNSDKYSYNDKTGEFTPRDRFWITKKLDLYAAWRQTVEGARGIGIIYDANGGTIAPEDTKVYLDKAKAIAQAASKAPEGKQFGYWVVQQWDDTVQNQDGTTGAYVDTTTTVFPGDEFTVLKDYAKQVIEDSHTVDVPVVDEEGEPVIDEETGQQKIEKVTVIDKATYTVQLRAEYTNAESEVPTYIPWFENDGTEAFHIDTLAEDETDYTKSTLSINEAVDIQAPPEKAGYTFLGWKIVNMGNSATDASSFMSTQSNWTQTITAPDVYYNAKDKKFYRDFDEDEGTYSNEAKKMAADEATPYQAVFAVWKVNQYTVTYYKEDGETVVETFANKEYGTVITVPAGPTKPADAENTYTFAGWELVSGTALGTGNTVAGDATYKATYTPTKNKYTVTYYKEDGETVVETFADKEYGTVITVPQGPAKAADDQYTYTFAGWELVSGKALGEGNKVVGDATYKAKYTSTVNKYKVTFVDEDGTTVLLAAKEYEYGTKAADITKPADPTKPADASYTYTFAGWSPTIADVTADATYKATYDKKSKITPVPIDDPDVPLDLNAVDHFAYVEGYKDGTFKPDGKITRAETATMIYRLLKEESRAEIFTADNAYTDVEKSLWYNKAVSSMTNGEYINGYPDGTFKGNQTITRAEFVTILVRFLNGPKEGENPFSDIDGHWAKDYIITAVQAGWIDGYPDGTFKPSEPIKRCEAVKIINSVLHRGVNEESELGDYTNFPDNDDPSAWYYFEVIEAGNNHDTEGERPDEDWISNECEYEYDIVKYERPDPVEPEDQGDQTTPDDQGDQALPEDQDDQNPPAGDDSSTPSGDDDSGDSGPEGE